MQLDKLISNPKVIVIQSERENQVVVTATRVPLGDIRLEEWGWILSLSHVNNHDQDGLEELSGRDGKHFPKLYSLDELKEYADQWQCTEWEDAYQKQNGADLSLQNTTVLAPSLSEKNEILKETMAEIQSYITQQLASLRKDIEDRLQNHMQTLTVQAEGNGQRTILLSTQTEILTKKFEDLENNSGTVTAKTTHLTEQGEMLATKVNEITTKLDDIKEKINKVIVESESSKTGNSDDVESIASEIEKKSSSQIEKIAMNQVRLSNGFYNNVKTQSKQSFELARFLVIVGAGIFVISMIAFIIPISKGNTTLVGSIGIATSCIVEAIGGLSFLYNKASIQFAHFHLFLDRINRATIAYTMCDGIEEFSRKQEQVILVQKELLKGDEKIKTS